MKPSILEVKQLEKEAENSSEEAAKHKRQRSPDIEDDQRTKKLKLEDKITEELKTSEPATKQQQQQQSQTDRKRNGKTRRYSVSQKSKKTRKKYHSSATPQKLDGEGKESVAVCALCHKEDSMANLGFLYGPYKPAPSSSDGGTESVAGGATKGTTESEEGKEGAPALWVHEDCAVWAPGVCLLNGKLLGLHEAVSDGKDLVCTVIFRSEE